MFDIVITSKDRFNYLRITLATLKEGIRYLDPTSFNIYLWDNSTSSLPDIVNEFSNLIVVRQNPIWAGAYSHTRYNNVITDAFIRSDKEYLFQLDADGVLHPDFYSQCLTLLNDFPGIGYAGIFNTPTHPPTATIRDKYVKKNVIGFFATLISRTTWNALHKSGHTMNDDVEYGLARFCNGTITTINSYVEHIGISGSHQHCDGSVDRAKNFFN